MMIVLIFNDLCLMLQSTVYQYKMLILIVIN